MAWRKINDSLLTGIADAIRQKHGSNDSYLPQDMAAAIANLPTAGDGAEEERVRFYDYDGTLLHDYSLSETQALTALPALPTQPGLLCQEWNWTLQEIKDEGRGVDVGATYITADGKTRLYIDLTNAPTLAVILTLTATPAGAMTLDWGDGSPAESNATEARIAYTHTYASAGAYVISTAVTAGGKVTMGGMNNCILIHDGLPTGLPKLSPLRRVEIGSQVTLSQYAFCRANKMQSVTIPGGYTNMPSSLLDCCASLTSLVIPRGVTTLFNSFLSKCVKMETVSLPCTLRFLSNYVFQNDSALKRLYLPKNVELDSGYSQVFSACLSLEKMVLPGATKVTNKAAFGGCASLKEVEFPSGFYALATSSFSKCVSLERIELPESLTTIGDQAFYECKRLKEVRVPSGITRLQAGTFNGCSGLTHVELPEGLTGIAGNAFESCECLTEITIPQNVTSIGTRAFYQANMLREVRMLPSTPPVLGSTSIFSKTNLEAIFVPAGSGEAYRTATNWTIYAACIREEATTA